MKRSIAMLRRLAVVALVAGSAVAATTPPSRVRRPRRRQYVLLSANGEDLPATAAWEDQRNWQAVIRPAH